MSPVLEEGANERLGVSIIVGSWSREEGNESGKSLGAKIALVFNGTFGIKLFQRLEEKERLAKQGDVAGTLGTNLFQD